MQRSNRTPSYVRAIVNEALGANPCADLYETISALLAHHTGNTLSAELPAHVKFVSTRWTPLPMGVLSTVFFTSIQAAMAQITLERTDPTISYQIIVYDGTYEGDVVFVPNVAVVGVDRTTTILRGNVTMGPNATLSRMDIQGNLTVDDTTATDTTLIELNNILVTPTVPYNWNLTGRGSDFTVIECLQSDLVIENLAAESIHLRFANSQVSVTGTTTWTGALQPNEVFVVNSTWFSSILSILETRAILQNSNMTIPSGITLGRTTMFSANHCTFDPTTGPLSSDMSCQLYLNDSVYNSNLLYSASPVEFILVTSQVQSPTDRTLDAMLVSITLPIQIVPLVIPMINPYTVVLTPMNIQASVPYVTGITPTEFVIHATTVTNILVTLTQPFTTAPVV